MTKLLYTDDKSTRERYNADMDTVYNPLVILAKCIIGAGLLLAIVIIVI